MTTTTRRILAVVLSVAVVGFLAVGAMALFGFKLASCYGSSALGVTVVPPSLLTNPTEIGLSSAGVPLPDDQSRKTDTFIPIPGSGDALAVPAAERLMVKTGTLSVRAKDVRWATGAVAKYAAGHGGTVIQSSLEKMGNELLGTITIRVPADTFEAALNEIKNYGTTVSETTAARDVTREYVDLNARLKNIQASEAQLLELMKRAGTIADVLNVQRELTTTRSDIEAMQAQIKYLQQSSSFSTLTVFISSDPAALPVAQDPSERWQPKAIVKAALRALIAAGQVAVNAAIWIVIFIPVWAPLLLVAWGLIRLFRRLLN